MNDEPSTIWLIAVFDVITEETEGNLNPLKKDNVPELVKSIEPEDTSLNNTVNVLLDGTEGV